MSLATDHRKPSLRTIAAKPTALPRTLSAVAAAAAVTVALPLTACAQSMIPGGGPVGSSTDSLGSLAPERPLSPGPEV